MRIEERRRAYAEEIEAVAHLDAPALVDAFARVPREAFLGPGPWQIARGIETIAAYRTTRDDDPRHIYHNVLVAIDPARRLNNGQPSALAQWIDATGAGPGAAIAHIGCGAGYYTAIFAELVGPTGRVVGYEVDAGLAARAAANLAPWPWVTVEAGDAAAPAGPLDAIFVNAGCTRARPGWLDALAPGGRLVVPLTVHVPGMAHGVGLMLRLERPGPGAPPAGASIDQWPARTVSQVGIYDCAGARSAEDEAVLRQAVGAAVFEKLAVVALAPHARDEGCLAHLEGFCLRAGSLRNAAG